MRLVMLIALIGVGCGGDLVTGPSDPPSTGLEVWMAENTQWRCSHLNEHGVRVEYSDECKPYALGGSGCAGGWAWPHEQRIVFYRPITDGRFSQPQMDEMSRHECCHLALGHSTYESMDEAIRAEAEADACEVERFEP